uniref:Transposase n=1 Tax=Heterorhabditis bacteriophora TaxID=37862 RepID=A0A1I7XQC0_HETBA
MGTAREEQDVPKSGFNEDQSGKGDTRNGNANQVQTEEGCRLIKATATTSDDIIQDLLNDMRNSEKVS